MVECLNVFSHINIKSHKFRSSEQQHAKNLQGLQKACKRLAKGLQKACKRLAKSLQKACNKNLQLRNALNSHELSVFRSCKFCLQAFCKLFASLLQAFCKLFGPCYVCMRVRCTSNPQTWSKIRLSTLTNLLIRFSLIFWKIRPRVWEVMLHLFPNVKKPDWFHLYIIHPYNCWCAFLQLPTTRLCLKPRFYHLRQKLCFAQCGEGGGAAYFLARVSLNVSASILLEVTFLSPAQQKCVLRNLGGGDAVFLLCAFFQIPTKRFCWEARF